MQHLAHGWPQSPGLKEAPTSCVESGVGGAASVP